MYILGGNKVEKEKINIGDYVIYATKGICEVTDIETKKFDRDEKEYYVFAPVYDRMSTYFVPVDYDPEKVHIKSAITVDEANCILADFDDTEAAQWIKNPNERRQAFDLIYRTGERKDIIGVIKALKHHSEEQHKIGKQLYATDEKILRGCKHLIFDELAFVLDKEPKALAQSLGF